MGERLEGKVAIITGGGSGIGAATAERFVAEGARVALVDVQDDAGAATARALGDRAFFVHGDVSVDADVAGAVAATVERWGRLDVMFNNAGFGGANGPVDLLTGDDFDATMAVLLKGVFLGMKHAVPVMRAQRSGSIISTASVCGLEAGLGGHLYSTAKAAVIMLTRSVALELAEDDVRVNCICPGYVATPLLGNARLDRHGAETTAQRVAAARGQMAAAQPLQRTGEAEDIASMALFLAGDESRWITGTAQVVDGGLTVGTPWREQRPLLRSYRSAAANGPDRRPSER